MTRSSCLLRCGLAFEGPDVEVDAAGELTSRVCVAFMRWLNAPDAYTIDVR
jgi:hypothetical protein